MSSLSRSQPGPHRRPRARAAPTGPRAGDWYGVDGTPVTVAVSATECPSIVCSARTSACTGGSSSSSARSTSRRRAAARQLERATGPLMRPTSAKSSGGTSGVVRWRCAARRRAFIARLDRRAATRSCIRLTIASERRERRSKATSIDSCSTSSASGWHRPGRAAHHYPQQHQVPAPPSRVRSSSPVPGHRRAAAAAASACSPGWRRLASPTAFSVSDRGTASSTCTPTAEYGSFRFFRTRRPRAFSHGGMIQGAASPAGDGRGRC